MPLTLEGAVPDRSVDVESVTTLFGIEGEVPDRHIDEVV
jgi:hypothetical protein